MSPRWRRRLGRGALTLCAALIGAYALAWVVPLPARLASPSSPVVTWSDGQIAHLFVADDGRYRARRAAAEVDPHYLAALVAFEDGRFYRHPGVDPLALLRAVGLYLQRGRAVSGASTLTMQVVRMAEPRPRTVRSKLIEILRAVQLELRLSKAEILSHYLTFAPFGRNLEGVEAAAWAYFGHGAAHLSADEILVLLAVPMNPNRRYPSPANAARLRAGRDSVARRLAALKRLHPLADTPPKLEALLAQPVPEQLRATPRRVPHLAEWLRVTAPERERHPTTLDRGAQDRVEALVAGARLRARATGVDDVAVVVADHQRGALRALVGGFDFWEDRPGAQLQSFRLRRSPGSALKPFIYALSLDAGHTLPETRVHDVPRRWGTYVPENYDGSYRGLVSFEEALSLSLNIPFLDALKEVGVERFIATLRQGGATGLADSPGWYGLSAAIGAVEVSPLEMTQLYAALAEGGAARPLRLRTEDPSAEPVPLFAPGAAWLTQRALARRDRPDFQARVGQGGLPRGIHWKTGTSYGHRDAWSAGSDERHTVVVWLGNHDQRPAVDLVGAAAAGPLFFDVIEALQPKERPLAAGPPAELSQVELCAASGRLPTPACPHRVRARALRDHVPTEACTFHVAAELEVATGARVRPGCRAGVETETRTFTVWPSEVAEYLGERAHWTAPLPAWAPGCAPRAESTRPPEIVSPPPRRAIVLAPDLDPSDQELPLQARSDRADAQLSWFVDGAFLGAVAAEDRLWWTPSPGHHDILVVDSEGRSARRRLLVRGPTGR